MHSRNTYISSKKGYCSLFVENALKLKKQVEDWLYSLCVLVSLFFCGFDDVLLGWLKSHC